MQAAAGDEDGQEAQAETDSCDMPFFVSHRSQDSALHQAMTINKAMSKNNAAPASTLAAGCIHMCAWLVYTDGLQRCCGVESRSASSER